MATNKISQKSPDLDQSPEIQTKVGALPFSLSLRAQTQQNRSTSAQWADLEIVRSVFGNLNVFTEKFLRKVG